MPEAAGRIFLDDTLGRQGCTNHAECRAIVGNFRLVTGRLRRQKALYGAFTPSELATLPPQQIAANNLALGALDLDLYADEAALLEAARTVTEKKGRVTREIAHAERDGYYVKEFAFAQHIPDAVAIHRSKQVRNGRPVQGEFYLSSVEDLGGAPRMPIPIPVPPCPHHYWQHWGIFQQVDGHRQGDVQTNERLVGYIRLRRQGASASYSVIMGHGGHLDNGIMFMLHYRLAAAFIRNRPIGLRYLIYQHYTLGPTDPLGSWKHRALFKPYYLYYVADRRVTLPATPPMPGLGEGMMALKATIDQPWPEAQKIGMELGVAPDWLATLHQAWVMENTHTPGLILNLLRAAPTPSIENLGPFSSHLFPREVLGDAARIVVILNGQERGLDTLLPLAERNVTDVRVYHSDAAELEVLRETYSPAWQYAPTPDTWSGTDVDLVILDPPALTITAYVRDHLKSFLARYAGRLLLAVNGHLLNQFKCDADHPAIFAERIGRLLDAAVVCRSIAFRNSDPEDMFWANLEIGPSGCLKS